MNPRESIIPAHPGGLDLSHETAPLPSWSIQSPGSEIATRDLAGRGAFPSAIEQPISSVQYILQSPLGSGGMGEVWKALQVSLARPVAVKRLRPHGTDPAARRVQQLAFRQEAVIAGLLEHPNIVPVHDLGGDHDGSPLICMKLVEGESWERVLDRDLPGTEPEEFLARHLPILLAMAQAVAFAHSRGIVHRDLKPSQVMLGGYGEVLLTDWGLAISFGEDSARPLANGVNQHELPGLPTPMSASNPAGTPAFMAPEQTADHARDIGPWTDVYLLGGTLYLLLTGTPPHQGGTMAACLLEAQQGSVEPPSRRAPARHPPEALERLCLRALESDPRRRFLDGNEFVSALRECLSGAEARAKSRAITAKAQEAAANPGTDYSGLTQALSLLDEASRLWPENPQPALLRQEFLASQADAALTQGDLLLARISIDQMAPGDSRNDLLRRLHDSEAARHRARRERRLLRVASLALLLTSLAGGTWFALRLADRQELALKARDSARQSQARAEDLLGFMVGDLRERLDPIGRLEVLDAVGHKAHDYLESLPSAERGRNALQQRIRTAAQLAAIQRLQGDLVGSRQALDAAATQLARLPAARIDDAAALETAATLHLEQGLSAFQSGELDPARDAYQLALDEFSRLAALQPANQTWPARRVEAIQGLADNAATRGETTNTVQLYAEAIDTMEGQLAKTPDPRTRHALAILYLRQGVALQSSGEPEDGALRTEEAMAILTTLLADDPRNARWQSDLADAHHSRGAIYQGLGAPAKALPDLVEGERLSRNLSTSDPSNMQWKSNLAEAVFRRAQCLFETGAEVEAGTALDAAIALAREVVDRNPSNAEWKKSLATMLAEKGAGEVKAGRLVEAEKLYAEAVLAVQAVALADTRNIEFRQLLDAYRHPLQDLTTPLTMAGETLRAQHATETVIRALETLFAQDPAAPGVKFDLGTAHLYAASQGVERGHPDETTTEHIRRCETLMRGLAIDFPTDRTVTEILASIPSLYGRCLRYQGKYREALEQFRKMEDLTNVPPPKDPNADERRMPLILRASALRFQMAIMLDLRDFAAAEALGNRASTILEALDKVTGPGAPPLAAAHAMLTVSLGAQRARLAWFRHDVGALQRECDDLLKKTETRGPRELDARVIALALLGRFAEADESIKEREKSGPIAPDILKIVEETRTRARQEAADK